MLNLLGNTLSYYNRQNAEQFKPVLDEILKTNKSMLIQYEDLDVISQNSAYLKIQRAFMYLAKHDDPKYNALRKMVTIRRTEEGIMLFLKKATRSAAIKASVIDTDIMFSTKDKKVPVMEQIESAFTDIRDKLLEFIESAEDGQILRLTDIIMTQEHKAEIKEILAQVEEFKLLKLTNDELKIIKGLPAYEGD